MAVEQTEVESGQSVTRLPASPTARRRMLRGGIAAAPVLMTIVSQPVAAAVACTTASAHGSMNASHVRANTLCSGKTPEFWQDGKTWPAGFKPNGSTATLFTPIFSTGNLYSGMTFLQVLNNGAGSIGRDGLARYLVAACLNAASGAVPSLVLSQAIAQGIWTSFVNKGYYEPTAGIRWDATAIIAWIRTTVQ